MCIIPISITGMFAGVSQVGLLVAVWLLEKVRGGRAE